MEEETGGERVRGMRALASDTIVYGFARAVFAFVQLFLVPIYTRYFSVAEYGIIENLNALGFFALTLFGAALPAAVVQACGREGPESHRSIVSSAAYANLALAIALLLVGVIGAAPLGSLLVRGNEVENEQLMTLAFAGYAMTLQVGLLLSVFRARFDSRRYLAVSLGSVIVTVALNLAFVVGLGLGVAGTLAAGVIAQLAASAYCVVALRGLLAPGAFDRARLARLVAFGFPFLFAAAMATIMRSSDRYFLSALVIDPLPKIGLYAMAEKCLAPVALLTYAFGLAWAPFAMAISRQPNAQETYVRSFKYYVAATSWLAVVCAALSPAALRLLTTPPYHAAAAFTPGVGVYTSLHYLYYIGSLGLLLTERTAALGPAVVVAAGVNITCNLLWIPRFEVGGAIASTIVALVTYNALIFAAGERRHYVGFPLVRGLALYATSFGAATLALKGLAAAAIAVLLQLVALRALGFLELERLPALVADLRQRLAGAS